MLYNEFMTRIADILTSDQTRSLLVYMEIYISKELSIQLQKCFYICDRICEKGSSTHIQLYKLWRQIGYKTTCEVENFSSYPSMLVIPADQISSQ